jgi:hypothetical protein
VFRQRIPLILGSRHEVKELVRFHEAYKRREELDSRAFGYPLTPCSLTALMRFWDISVSGNQPPKCRLGIDTIEDSVTGIAREVARTAS